MEHDTESGPTSSAGNDLPGDPTGDPRVDQVLQGLAELPDLPVTEHPPVYERIHGDLAEVLGKLRPGVGPADETRAGG
jgi:hypothetical protein